MAPKKSLPNGLENIRAARPTSRVKKRLKYSKTKAVKAIARTRVGAPPPARLLDEKPVRVKPKHKKSWTAEAEE